MGILCESDASEISVRQEAGRFATGRGHYCGAHSIWSVGIDDKGNLQKCWEAVDKPWISFGTAHDWDPKDPLLSASNPDNLTMYLNTACPVPDEECRECVWLPSCVGGCPHKRLFEKRSCIAFKDDPESYVLAHRRKEGRAGSRLYGRGLDNGAPSGLPIPTGQGLYGKAGLIPAFGYAAWANSPWLPSGTFSALAWLGPAISDVQVQFTSRSTPSP